MKFLVYGQNGWIGKQFCSTIQLAGDEVLSGSRIAVIEDVLADIKKWSPDRVICCLGRTFGPGSNTIDYLEQPGKLPENVALNLTAPVLIALATSRLHGKTIPMLYVGSGCIFEYDEAHPVGSRGFTEEDDANFFGSSYSIVKGQTDLLMKGLPHVLNARVRMPISDEMNSRDFITKIASYKKIISINNSMTILSDWIPFLIALLADGKNGTINAVNPGTIDHETILQQYEAIAHKKLDYQLVSPSEQSSIVTAKRSNNSLVAEKAESMMLELQSATRKKYGVPEVLRSIDERIGEVLALRFTTSAVVKTAPIQNGFVESHNKVILVTGGAGFIGSNFVNYWLKHHPQDIVINLDGLLTNSNLRNIENPKNPHYEFIHASLLDEKALRRAFESYHVSHVVHFAAASTVDPSFDNPHFYIENNIIGTLNLLEAVKNHCANLRLFVHISTDEVYGEMPSGSCVENHTPFLPTNPYAATKAGAECLVMSYGASYGLPYIITRANNIYGKYQFPTQVIPKFISCLLTEQKLPVHGSGLTSRRFLYVEDYCRALQTVMEKGLVGEVYNIGTDNEIQIKDLCRILVSKIHGVDDHAEHVEFVTDRPHNDCRYAVDSTKIQALGWAPTMDFDAGLDRTVEWYRSALYHWEETAPVQSIKTFPSPVFQSTWSGNTEQKNFIMVACDGFNMSSAVIMSAYRF